MADLTGAGWRAALADLEEQTARLRHALEGGIEAYAGLARETPERAWRPPSGLGPLPRDLGQRAAELLREIAEVKALTEGARRDAGRQLAAVRSVPRAHDAGASVYVDLTG